MTSLAPGVFVNNLFSNHNEWTLLRSRREDVSPAFPSHSTVTLLARLRGWSTLVPRSTAMW